MEDWMSLDRRRKVQLKGDGGHLSLYSKGAQPARAKLGGWIEGEGDILRREEDPVTSLVSDLSPRTICIFSLALLDQVKLHADAIMDIPQVLKEVHGTSSSGQR
jgi:hypothetical protein